MNELDHPEQPPTVNPLPGVISIDQAIKDLGVRVDTANATADLTARAERAELHRRLQRVEGCVISKEIARHRDKEDEILFRAMTAVRALTKRNMMLEERIELLRAQLGRKRRSVVEFLFGVNRS